MLVVRTDRSPAEMPLDANGLAIDEESGLIHIAGEASSLLIGEHHRLTLDLPPGHYLLLCNLEGHFLSDMHSAFDVR
jgi:uncharacterized cupredoxin-like copper-binding protein